MKKHQWRQQVKSLFESHVDQDKREQLKKTRKDMEDRKEKIIHLVKGEDQNESNGNSESLEKLVKDYHKEYESLYELYHNLTGELKKKVHGRHEEDKEKFSSSSSDSESELDNNELKEKLESFNQTVEELTREKSILIEEKDSAIKRAEEAEVKFAELKENIEMKWEPKTEALTSQINSLEKETELLRGQKRDLEEQLINKSNEASEQMKEVFDQLNSFQKELMTLVTIKAEMETELEKKSNEVSESMTQISDLTEKLANSEEDQKRILEEKNSLESEIIELQTTVEDLKRDIEMDKDELMTIEEKNRNIEVMLRLSNQKLRVTEQLLKEKEEITVALSKTLESYTDMIKEISDQTNAITSKFDEGFGGLAKRVAVLCDEVLSVKRWMVKVKEEGGLMKERIEKLVMEGEKEREEKEVIKRRVSEISVEIKDKEERLMGLGDEKREAIKQLCVWIEEYRSRCVELRGMLVKVAPKLQRNR